jgi:hypothetical protein
MEPYCARFKERAMIKWMRDFRSLAHTRQGGDLSLLYGVKELAAE